MSLPLSIALLLLSSIVHSAPVVLKLPSKVDALAEYKRGDRDKPAVLLMHGFLQTHKFHTIHQLSESLNDEGFTTLAPTISLNIPHRKKSLACEAIHTHTLQDAHKEIDSWLKWLQSKGHNRVTLMGHSTGSMMLLSYLNTPFNPIVKKLIGISIVEGRLELAGPKREKLRRDIKQLIDSGSKRLIKQQFSFCKPLHATPQSLLSYIELTPENILHSISRITVPQVYIMGSKDDRLGDNWTGNLQQTGKPVHIIDGANHFMDGEYEFDLLEIVLSELQ